MTIEFVLQRMQKQFEKTTTTTTTTIGKNKTSHVKSEPLKLAISPILNYENNLSIELKLA